MTLVTVRIDCARDLDGTNIRFNATDCGILVPNAFWDTANFYWTYIGGAPTLPPGASSVNTELWVGGSAELIAGDGVLDGHQVFTAGSGSTSINSHYTAGGVGQLYTRYFMDGYGFDRSLDDQIDEMWIEGSYEDDGGGGGGGPVTYDYSRGQYTFTANSDLPPLVEVSEFDPAPGLRLPESSWYHGIGGYWSSVTAMTQEIIDDSVGTQTASFTIAVHFMPLTTEIDADFEFTRARFARRSRT